MTAMVTVKETKLSDGSKVFDVVNIPDSEIKCGGRVIISAESEKAAWVIADAINEYAVDVYGANA